MQVEIGWRDVLVVPAVFAAMAIVVGCAKKQEPISPPAEMERAMEKVVPEPAEEEEEEKEETPQMELTLTSSAFSDGETIPETYTADGEDISPPLSWTAPPVGTEELVLICDDPDAPAGVWDHWVVYGMSPQVGELDEGIPTEREVSEPRLVQGTNDFGNIGYGGPAPPAGSGAHRYRFTLYAVDTPLNLPPAEKKDDVLSAMEGHVVGKAQLVGRYSR